MNGTASLYEIKDLTKFKKGKLIRNYNEQYRILAQNPAIKYELELKQITELITRKFSKIEIQNKLDELNKFMMNHGIVLNIETLQSLPTPSRVDTPIPSRSSSPIPMDQLIEKLSNIVGESSSEIEPA